MAERPRILVFEGPGGSAETLLQAGPAGWDQVRVHSLREALGLLQAQPFAGLFADYQDPAIRQRLTHLLQSDSILQALNEGVALVDPQLRVTWANATFEKWCGGPVGGRGFYEALGSPETLGPDYSPFYTALGGQTVSTCLHCRDNRYLELHVAPVGDPSGPVRQLLALCRDITAEAQQQQKLDALHRAGRDLAGLDPDQLAEMSIAERIELLKQNIRRYTHDLLHYDVVEIRLLDRQTGRLEPLLQEGMGSEASQRVLYARSAGQGVTGFVAATGKSYLCPDTAVDPLYIEGAPGARSSLTVPLIFQDQVIGTFNVESPKLNAFGEDDQQFAEIFSRELAGALHTLELLTAEKRSTANQSIEAISREVALPVDEILAAAVALLDQEEKLCPETEAKLRQILASARLIRECIQKVGQNLVPGGPDGQVAPRLKGLRVLVADSDERVRRSAHSLLGRFGCTVETARDGREAVAMARVCTYDAILADIRLPDLSGYDVFRRLREAQPQARVILMTAFGYDPSHSIVKARQEGLRFVLFKPFRPAQLLDALNDTSPEPTPVEAPPEPVQA